MIKTVCEDSTEEIMFSDFRNDNQDFFFNIYDSYSPALLGLIIKWVKDKETAEILLCNTFIKAWQNRKSYNAEKEIFFNWLCRLARISYTDYMSI